MWGGNIDEEMGRGRKVQHRQTLAKAPNSLLRRFSMLVVG